MAGAVGKAIRRLVSWRDALVHLVSPEFVSWFPRRGLVLARELEISLNDGLIEPPDYSFSHGFCALLLDRTLPDDSYFQPNFLKASTFSCLALPFGETSPPESALDAGVVQNGSLMSCQKQPLHFAPLRGVLEARCLGGREGRPRAGGSAALRGAPSLLPGVREQLTSQQDMFVPSFQAVARALYFDEEQQKLKRGSGSKGAGSRDGWQLFASSSM